MDGQFSWRMCVADNDGATGFGSKNLCCFEVTLPYLQFAFPSRHRSQMQHALFQHLLTCWTSLCCHECMA